MCLWSSVISAIGWRLENRSHTRSRRRALGQWPERHVCRLAALKYQAPAPGTGECAAFPQPPTTLPASSPARPADRCKLAGSGETPRSNHVQERKFKLPLIKYFWYPTKAAFHPSFPCSPASFCFPRFLLSLPFLSQILRGHVLDGEPWAGPGAGESPLLELPADKGGEGVWPDQTGVPSSLTHSQMEKILAKSQASQERSFWGWW